MATQSPAREELQALYADVMADEAVTNISGWTEPNHDKPCDEQEYRQRLEQNAPILFEKLKEAMRFE